MDAPDYMLNVLAKCRDDVNRQVSLEYLTLFNNPETLTRSFNGRMQTASESFELLAPEEQGAEFLYKAWEEARKRMSPEELPALCNVISMQLEGKVDPVDRTEAIEMLFLQSEATNYQNLLRRQVAYQKFRQAVPETNIQALLSHTQTALENHPYTAGHAARVMFLGMAFLDWCIENVESFPISRVSLIDARDAYVVHDIGKNALSEAVLDSARELRPDEWEKMRNHPIVSANIIRPVGAFAEEVNIVMDHHEKWNGKGYPHGKKGNDIHPLARVCAISDSMDAMTSGRAYQKRHKTDEEATSEIVACAGKMYDPYYARQFHQFMAAHNYDVEQILNDNSLRWLDLSKYEMKIPTINRRSSMPPPKPADPSTHVQ